MKNKILDWIDGQKGYMLDLLKEWANINTHSFNISGLNKLAELLYRFISEISDKCYYLDLDSFNSLGMDGKRHNIKLGRAIRGYKRLDSPKRIFLSIHYDTVFLESYDFPVSESADILRGPGVLDAKSGIIIMLMSLMAFEHSEYANSLGWDIFINPDEEIGSIGSAKFFKELSKDSLLALVYEPCLSDGSMVISRKGSANFTLVVHGKSAHAGREHHLGINAIDILSEIILKLSSLTGKRDGLTVNVGSVKGGGVTNVVPDRAGCAFNIRVGSSDDVSYVESFLDGLIRDYKNRSVKIEVDGIFLRPPKHIDEKTKNLQRAITDTANSLGERITWTHTGGVCDGNIISSMGIPVVDTMGAMGSGIHSGDEFLYIDSLVERTKLTTIFLTRLANGDFKGLL